jgi:hypothetical protein
LAGKTPLLFLNMNTEKGISGNTSTDLRSKQPENEVLFGAYKPELQGNGIVVGRSCRNPELTMVLGRGRIKK